MTKSTVLEREASLFRRKKKKRPPPREVNWALRHEISNYYLKHKPRFCELANKFCITPDQARRIAQQASKLSQHVEQSGGLSLTKVHSSSCFGHFPNSPNIF